MLDFMTWDLIVKNTPKLMLLEIIIHRNQIKNKRFFTTFNDYQYNPPFLIFYPKRNLKENPQALTETTKDKSNLQP